MLRYSVQSVGLPRQRNIVGNIRLLANQLVRFHDKAADVPADHLKGDIAQRSGENRRRNPTPAPHCHAVDRRDHRTQNERRADNKHSCEHDVAVSVGHTCEDRMIIEQSLEPTDIHTHCKDQ